MSLIFVIFILFLADYHFAHRFSELTAAVYTRNYNKVTELISSKVDVNEYDGHGETALFFAVAARSHTLVSVLLKNRAIPF